MAAAIKSKQTDPDLITKDVAERLQQFVGFEVPRAQQRVVDGFSESLFQTYQQGLQGPIDREAGKAVFKRLCSSCHRVAGIGNQVGPDLKSLVDKPEEQILLSVMDPNREIDPRFRLVQVETINGRLVAGILQDETDDELVVVDSQGKEQRISRAEIEMLQTRPRSLMPEGLVREITVDQMRNLIGLLKQPE